METHYSEPSTIAGIESELQGAFEALREIHQRGQLPQELQPLLKLVPPDGASVHVSLRQRETGRQIRRTQPAGSWTQRSCAVWIVYEAPGAAPDFRSRMESLGNPLQEFVLALNHAERDPHLQFISLKWFRDTYLVKRGYGWAQDPDLPRQLTQELTERNLILTSKVPNPKTPEFPVTSIRLNREHPEVRKILADAGTVESAQAP
ncbi:MAG: hypothetical protein ACKVWV_11390 [Planctomycetota bacterium]